MFLDRSAATDWSALLRVLTPEQIVHAHVQQARLFAARARCCRFCSRTHARTRSVGSRRTCTQNEFTQRIVLPFASRRAGHAVTQFVTIMGALRCATLRCQCPDAALRHASLATLRCATTRTAPAVQCQCPDMTLPRRVRRSARTGHQRAEPPRAGSAVVGGGGGQAPLPGDAGGMLLDQPAGVAFDGAVHGDAADQPGDAAQGVRIITALPHAELRCCACALAASSAWHARARVMMRFRACCGARS